MKASLFLVPISSLVCSLAQAAPLTPVLGKPELICQSYNPQQTLEIKYGHGHIFLVQHLLAGDGTESGQMAYEGDVVSYSGSPFGASVYDVHSTSGVAGELTITTMPSIHGHTCGRGSCDTPISHPDKTSAVLKTAAESVSFSCSRNL